MLTWHIIEIIKKATHTRTHTWQIVDWLYTQNIGNNYDLCYGWTILQWIADDAVQPRVEEITSHEWMVKPRVRERIFTDKNIAMIVR